MKLSKIRDDYQEATAKVSDLARQFSFAGIAIIWTLKLNKDPNAPAYSSCLIIPLGLFVLTLSVDFLHYLYRALSLGIINSYFYQIHKNDEKDIDYPSWCNYLSLFLFWTKCATLAGAYMFLLKYFIEKVFIS
jgi:hypothetical protein